MALGNSQNSSNVPPELAPYYNAPSGSRLVGRIIRITLLVVAIFLLFLLFRWSWDKAHNNKSASKPSTSQSQQATNSQAKDQSKENPATTSSPSSTGSNPSQTPAVSEPAQNNAGSTATNSQPSTTAAAPSSQAATTTPAIPNTGPTAAVIAFVGAVVGGTILFEIYVRLKLAKH